MNFGDLVAKTELDLLRNKALDASRVFAEKSLEKSEFRPGESVVPVSGKVLDPDDLVSLVDSSLDGWLTAGRFTAEFERKLAKYVGVRSALFVNSGSSANLVALSGLTSPKLGKKALKPGDEVLTVAMGFPTTVNPIIQNGMRPVVVDVDLATYDAKPDRLREAVGPKTRAIMMAHTLGNPFDLDTVRELCEEHNLWLIEDSCDALGSTYDGQKTGSFGDTATASFYPAHHITTGEGGAVFCNDAKLKDEFFYSHNFGHNGLLDFHGLGINGKISELQAAMGLAVLPHMAMILEARKKVVYFYDCHLDFSKLTKMKLRNNTEWNYSYYPVVFETEAQLLAVQKVLNDNKIFPRRYFYPSLNTINYIKGKKMPVSESVASRILCLPLAHDLNTENLIKITTLINKQL